MSHPYTIQPLNLNSFRMSEKLDESLYASFEPTEAKLLTSSSNSQLLMENPILSSALSNIFPYLLLIDNVLEIITWTNEDPYQNFLMLVIYSVLVMYWNFINYIILPLLISISFSCVVWSISSVIYDSKFNEKPTIDEVLHTLHNITIRFEMLLRPVQHVNINFKNFLTIFIMTIILTPFHILLTKTIIPPQKYLWFIGLFSLTYHSPWSFSIRRLLWRSVYVRIIAFYITGLDIKLDRKNQKNHHASNKNISRIHSPSTSDIEEDLNNENSHKLQLLTDFKIIKKIIVSPTQLKQIVKFEILENERRWLGIGWSKFVLPNERPSYCYEQSLLMSPEPTTNNDVNFPFPIFENDLYSYLWEWQDDNWSLDHEFNKNKHKNGWVYFDNNWENESYEDGFSKYTRSRKWTRKAILLIDKQDSVNDE